MKTAREWFKELPDDIEKMAVENAESANYPITDEPAFHSLSHALSGSFIWSITPQGHAFWSNVQDQHCE